MNLQRWEELARQAIDGVADHVDEDSAVRKARLNRLSTYIAAKLVAIDEEIEAALADLDA